MFPAGPHPAAPHPRLDALRGTQGSGLPRLDPPQLRLHPLHRRSRPRRGGQLLRHLRRAPDLRRLHAGGARDRDHPLRAHLLVQGLRQHGLLAHLPPRRRPAPGFERHRGAGDAGGRGRSPGGVHAPGGGAGPGGGRGGGPMSYYPLFLDLRGEPCIVLGGGPLAAAKVRDLLLAEARITVISPELEAEAEVAAADPRVRVERRAYRAGDLAGSRLVIDASGDLEVNRASWQEAEAAGILINVVDVPDRCRFIAPAVVRREPLLVAISTAGESPFIASTPRARLERVLGPEGGPFTSLVGDLRRRLRKAGVPLDRQLKAYRRLLASEALGMLRPGEVEEAGREADAGADEVGIDRPGRVALVGAGPGDPRLLTVVAQ